MMSRPVHVVIHRRPVFGLGGAFILFVLFVLVGLIMTYWRIIVTVLGIGLVLYFLLYWCYALQQRKKAARITERQKIARLRRHAEGEVELVQEGDLAGWYGEYSPPPALRGVGIRT